MSQRLQVDHQANYNWYHTFGDAPDQPILEEEASFSVNSSPIGSRAKPKDSLLAGMASRIPLLTMRSKAICALMLTTCAVIGTLLVVSSNASVINGRGANQLEEHSLSVDSLKNTRRESATAIGQAQDSVPSLAKLLDSLDSMLHLPTTSLLDRSLSLGITYHGQPIQSGSFVPKSQAAQAPVLTLSGTSAHLYTIIMIDVDAPNPSNPNHSPYLHYIVSNYKPGSQNYDTTIAYVPVSPPIGTHRYIFLVFEQDRVLTEAAAPTSRVSFDISGYASQLNLQLTDTYLIFTSQPHT